MKRTLLLFLNLSFFLFTLQLQAQEPKVTPGVPNDRDKNNIPDNNSIFNSDNKNIESNNGAITYKKNSIRYNVSLLTRNIAAFSYERKIIDFFSFEGSLGICYNKDRPLLWEIELSDESKYHTTTGNYGLVDILKLSKINGSSLFSSLSVKFGDNVDEGWNFYWGITFRQYSNKIKLLSDKYNVVKGSSDLIIKSSNYYLQYGVQLYSQNKITTTHDFYMCLGIRQLNYEKCNVEQGYGNNQIDNYRIVSKTGTNVNFINLSIDIGYTFGFGF